MTPAKPMCFHDPDDLGDDAVSEGDGGEGGDSSEGDGGDSTPPPPPPPPSTFDPSAFAREFGTSVAEALRQQQPRQEEKPPMSDAERAKLMNVWEPDDAFFAEFGDLEKQRGAVAKMRDALMKQADTAAQVRLHILREELRKEFSPIMEEIQRHQEEQLEKRFAAAYGSVADPKLSPLRVAIVSQLAQEGKRFPNETALFDEVAKRMEATIQVTNPNFKLTQKKGGSGSGLPVTTPGHGGGGGGNGGGGGGGGSKTPLAVSLLPKVR